VCLLSCELKKCSIQARILCAIVFQGIGRIVDVEAPKGQDSSDSLERLLLWPVKVEIPQPIAKAAGKIIYSTLLPLEEALHEQDVALSRSRIATGPCPKERCKLVEVALSFFRERERGDLDLAAAQLDCVFALLCRATTD